MHLECIHLNINVSAEFIAFDNRQLTLEPFFLYIFFVLPTMLKLYSA